MKTFDIIIGTLWISLAIYVAITGKNLHLFTQFIACIMTGIYFITKD